LSGFHVLHVRSVGAMASSTRRSRLSARLGMTSANRRASQRGVTAGAPESRASLTALSISQGLEVLSRELRLHRMSADVAKSVASEIQQCVLHGNRGQVGCNDAIRRVLRHLRKLRAGGSTIDVGGVENCSNIAQEVCAVIYTKYTTTLVSMGRSSSTDLPTAHAPGVACHMVPPQASDADKVCFVVHGVMTPDECRALIVRCEGEGWHPASLAYDLASGEKAGDEAVLVGRRDSDRCILNDDDLASKLWRAIETLVPPRAFEPLRPTRINSCLRCLRYRVGQAGFAKHVDGRCVVGGEISRVSVMLYLNDDFVGGATRLCCEDDAVDALRGVDVAPRTGMALVFDQGILHKGSPVRQGVKYSVRTEVMYR